MDCPPTPMLRQLCDGSQPPEEELHLLAHLNECESCRSQIEQLGARTAEAAKALATGDTVCDSKVLRQRLETLKDARPSATMGQGTTGYQDVAPWIEDDDGKIGRIDEYDLVRFIGRGGMGVVFEALDRNLQRPVALKMMSPALLTDESNSRRFLREARAAAAINHPAVVSIYSVSKTGEMPYLVMELVEGQSLQQRLEQGPISKMDQVCGIAAHISDGLAAAHAKGVVHRDVKPANILIERGTGRVKLTDFGLARSASDEMLTNTGTLLGTPEYLAPEQVDGQDVDHRADLFSLGSVIYHMCVGKPPYLGKSLAATLHAVATAKPVRLSNVNVLVPEWLSRLVTSLHAKNPAERPDDANAIAAALRSNSGDLPSGARRQLGGSKHLSGWWMTGIAAALLLGLVAIAAFRFMGSEESDVFLAYNSDDLMEYFETHEGDGLIELTSAGPYHLDAFEIEERHLEIVSSEEVTPTLVFHVIDSESVIHCEHGHLELSGVRIEVVEDEEEREVEEFEDSLAPVISCMFGSLGLRDCQIVAGRRTCLRISEAACSLIDSELTAAETAIEFVSSDATSLSMEGTTIESDVGIFITEPTEGELVLNQSRFEGSIAFELDYFEDNDARAELTAIGCEFTCEATLLSLLDVPPEALSASWETVLQNHILWQGSRNTLPATVIRATGETDEIEYTVSRKEWTEANAP